MYRGWELPKRCKVCRKKKKEMWQKKEAEEAAIQFEKELASSLYTIKEISEIRIDVPATTLYVDW